MTQEEENRIEIIERSLPAIVSISVSKKITTPSVQKIKQSFPVFERNKSKIKVTHDQREDEQLDCGGGSGFIADTTGIVITNIHVIKEGSLDYEVTLHDNTIHKAQLIDMDPVHDVAYLQIMHGDTFPTLSLGDSTQIKLGQTVYAIGDVLGVFPDTISRGIISGLGRTIEAHSEDRKEVLHDLIQTDAAINPGNSGGPLIDSSGSVIGINSANVARAENIGFAIPINAIKNDLEDIKQYGKIRRAFLGVRHVVITPTISLGLKLARTHGIFVTSPSPHQPAVIPKSPADHAGLRADDIIISINGTELNERYTLEDFLEDSSGGMEAEMTVLRNDREIKLVATLLERPQQ
ncbi:MAG: trypsin-like peptidase domain-containing protein [Candidatus Paceibacterota bacterium]